MLTNLDKVPHKINRMLLIILMFGIVTPSSAPMHRTTFKILLCDCLKGETTNSLLIYNDTKLIG
jgi:hypothetical protein